MQVIYENNLEDYFNFKVFKLISYGNYQLILKQHLYKSVIAEIFW